MANDYDFDASSYPLWQPGWVPPMAPPSPYGNDLWHVLGTMLGFDPDGLRRLDAALASSPRSADQNGAAPSDQRAAGYDQLGERGAVGVAKQFGPWNMGGFADATSPANPASYGSNVSAPGLASVPIDDRDLRWAVTNTIAALYGQKFRPYMAGRTFGALESLTSDAPQPFTLAHVDVALRQLGDIAAGQGPDAAAAALAADDLRKRMPNLAPRGVSAGDPAAAPTMLQDDRAPAQWGRPEAPASQGPDALADAQPTSWPEPPERSDFKTWAPNQQPTNEGRETGPSDLVRMLTGFGQGDVVTNSWSGDQAGAQPQWWRPEAPASQWPDAPANTQPISAPALPEQRDLKDWWPTQEPTSEGRETGPSDSGWWAPGSDLDDPLILAARKPRKRPEREPLLPPPPEQRGGLPIDLLEEEARGGHGWADHVHRNAAALTRQIRDKFVERPWLRDVREGSFLSYEAGTKLTNSTLAQNKPIVDQVATGKLDRATAYRSPTGFEAWAAHRGANVHVDLTYGVSVHIVHDPQSPTGYTVWSYYPSNRKD